MLQSTMTREEAMFEADALICLSKLNMEHNRMNEVVKFFQVQPFFIQAITHARESLAIRMRLLRSLQPSVSADSDSTAGGASMVEVIQNAVGAGPSSASNQVTTRWRIFSGLLDCILFLGICFELQGYIFKFSV